MNRPLKSKAIERLRRALDAILELQGRSLDSPDFKKWHRDTEVAIENTFGGKSRHIGEFQQISYWAGVMPSSSSKDRRDYLKGLESATALLESMIGEIEEYWEDEDRPDSTPSTKTSEQLTTNEVFVVHGRDEGAKDAVARFLTKLGLEPVVLHEQPNQGRTIIEKFEEYAQVGFAVVLLTPDDVGGPDGQPANLRPRARQNVILELGFFLGKLGRDRTCALRKQDTEIPSDYDGVIYIPMDDHGAWEMKLLRELNEGGFDVDANVLL